MSQTNIAKGSMLAGYNTIPVAYESLGNTTHSNSQHKANKFFIVSNVAFLIGVPEKYFDEEELYEQVIFSNLSKNKNARIIRNLCILRTTIELYFDKLIKEVNKGRSVLNIDEYISPETISQLKSDGIYLPQKSNMQPSEYVIAINKQISNRINNCKDIFPTWLNWDYVKDLFIPPDAFTSQGTAQAAKQYYKNKNCYPFHIFINWNSDEPGNILYNDRKFISCIYEAHNDCFTDLSKVMDASDFIKEGIYAYIEAAHKICMIVDCENSDVYKIISMLTSLHDDCLSKITKIILIDDKNTSVAWKELQKYTDIPVEYILTERIHEKKSQVDGAVIVKTCKEFYKENVDSFVLLSSDSDFWTLINMLEEVNFLVMVEESKCGQNLINKLNENSVFWCYLDDFYSGDESQKLKISILARQMAEALKTQTFNISDMLNDTLQNLRLDISKEEKDRFFSKYIKTAQLVISDEGIVTIEWKK